MIIKQLINFIDEYKAVNCSGTKQIPILDEQIRHERTVDFVMQYSEEFNVDLSKFDSSKYTVILNKGEECEPNKIEITFDMLVQGIQSGSLDPSTNPEPQEDDNRPIKLTTKKILLGFALLIVTTFILSIIAKYT